MQSGYGGVSEIQQFMVDGCASSHFSISTIPPTHPAVAVAATSEIPGSQTHQKYHPLHHPHHPHHQHPPPEAAPQHFPHFHPIPITQQLFHQTHHHHHQHQFQLFHHHHHHQQEQRRMLNLHHQQQLGMDGQDSGQENSTSPVRMMGGDSGGGGHSFLSPAMNFKLAVNESSGGGSRNGLNDDDGILQGDDGSESRLHHWHREEESAIKEPFWRPLDIDYINPNNKRCKEKQPETSNKYCKKSKEASEHHHTEVNTTSGNNYKLFSELEAIYKPGGGNTIVGSGGGNNNNNNQTGSGSALTGDENPLVTATAIGPPAVDQRANQVSDTSTGGGEVPLKKFHKGGSSSRRKRKRRQQQLSSIAAFFETLVKQLMDHQEGLHRKFLEVMERRDRERTSREEAWRKQETAKSTRDATARAEERALAATREAAIISFLEKITGETLDLPTKSQFQSQLLADESQKDQDDNNPTNPNTYALEAYDTFNNNNAMNKSQLNTSRWPKAEVQALIRVRSGFESRFQEPGLKGPLWEEVSSMMSSMGYHRSPKRCKEKWENINKYFRKTKDSGKKRPQHSKTCPYFHQLDQLYSKSLPIVNPALTAAEERKDCTNSELLDAIIVSTDHQSFKFSEMDSMRFEFNSKVDKGHQRESGNAGDEEEEEEEEEEDEEVDEEEGEGESQLGGQAQDREQQQHQVLHQVEGNSFFQRLHS